MGLGRGTGRHGFGCFLTWGGYGPGFSVSLCWNFIVLRACGDFPPRLRLRFWGCEDRWERVQTRQGCRCVCTLPSGKTSGSEAPRGWNRGALCFWGYTTALHLPELPICRAMPSRAMYSKSWPTTSLLAGTRSQSHDAAAFINCTRCKPSECARRM